MNHCFQGLLLASLIALGACSPFGRKSEPKDLFPADSLSRELAQSVAPELLNLNWRMDGGENSFFSSLVLGSDSTVWVGDLGSHSIRRFTFDGRELPPKTGFSFPYLTGRGNDTIAVYSAGMNRLVAAADPDRGYDLPPLGDESVALGRQVAILDEVIYVKDAYPPTAVIHRLTGSGAEDSIVRLPGPSWNHYGVLRVWLDRIVSASSYRPILYLLDSSGEIDSLRLQGFDSPMLARIRAYASGQVDEPPLVISGLYGTSDELYVINVRPGVLRIDVFDRRARLKRVLQHEAPEPTGFTPIDLVIRHDRDSTYAYVGSVNAVYGSLSLQYASRLDRFSFARDSTME